VDGMMLTFAANFARDRVAEPKLGAARRYQRGSWNLCPPNGLGFCLRYSA